MGQEGWDAGEASITGNYIAECIFSPAGKRLANGKEKG
jgi:hypothetical protein